MILALISIAHFLVDGVCAASLYEANALGEDIILAVLLYNTLAFTTQCIAGSILDSIGHAKDLGRIAMFVVALGSFIPCRIVIKACIVGLGNSLFHVACGSMTIMKYSGHAAELGVFVAPGTFGVTLGTLSPGLKMWFAAALLVIGAILGHTSNDDMDYNSVPGRTVSADSSLIITDAPTPADLESVFDPSPTLPAREKLIEPDFPVLEVSLLTAAVMVRAIGGSAVDFSWQSGTHLAIIMASCIFAGKLLGGFALEKLGTVKTAFISIVPAAICIAFFSSFAVPSLIGQLLLNLTMPVTLFMLIEEIPDSPGLAFGLAASALWPGTIIGNMFKLTGPVLWLCVIVSFAFGLFAILYCEKNFRS